MYNVHFFSKFNYADTFLVLLNMLSSVEQFILKSGMVEFIAFLIENFVVSHLVIKCNKSFLYASKSVTPFRTRA